MPEDLPMYGRADRVEQHGGEVRIIDLKTGWGRPTELRPSHRRQLLVYAFLWNALHGAWPKEAAIQRLDGSRLTLAIDPEEAKSVADELLAQREKFNSALERVESTWSLASPSAEACQYCDYKVTCPEFFGQVAEAWGWYRRHLLGIVSAVTPIGEVSRLDLDVEAGNVGPDTPTARLIGAPFALVPDVGARVAIVDALPTPTPTEFRVAWDSQICVWS
jgi:hypothetical protein